MPSAPSAAALIVFDSIMNSWIAHLHDIDRLVLRVEEEKENWKAKKPGRRKWSFEEELNRWARDGCRTTLGWESPDNCRRIYPDGLIPDAVVTVPDCQPIVVEVKAVTNVTTDKWIEYINEDTRNSKETLPTPVYRLSPALTLSIWKRPTIGRPG